MSVARKRLVTTALDLFLHHGLQSVGIDWILREASVSKMTLYKYFPSKEDLIEAVLREYHENIFNELRAGAGHMAGDVNAHLEQLLAWYSRNFVEAPVRGCLFGTAALVYIDKQHPIHIAAYDHKQALLGLLAQLLGGYGFSSPQPLALQCLMVIEGARNLFDIGVKGQPLEQALVAIRVLLAAARPAVSAP